MDDSSDDDIELIAVTRGSRSSESGLDEVDSNTRPILLRQDSNTEDSIPVATVHALQISFNSLQQKLNEKTKENKALIQENKRIKHALKVKEYSNRELVESVRDRSDTMDLSNGMESSAHAAGGTSEDDFLAEHRANKGLIHHLQKEVLVRDNALNKTRDEVYRLKYNMAEMEKEIANLLREKQKLLTENYGQSSQETTDQLREEINFLNQKLEQAEKSNSEDVKGLKMRNSALEQELAQLKQKNDEDVRKLRLSLSQYENDLKKSIAEIQKLRREKETFEARCKQYEIEVEIGRGHQQSLRRIDEADDVDGDINTLNAALELVKKQKSDYAELKKKVSSQASVIKELAARGPSRPQEPRSEAQGASISAGFEDSAHPVYMNMGPGTMNDYLTCEPQHHVPLVRRQSDRGEYGNQRLSPRSDDSSTPVQSRMLSPVTYPGARRESPSPVLNRRMIQETMGQDTQITAAYRYENSPIVSPRIQHTPASTHYITTSNTRVNSPSPDRTATGNVLNTSFGCDPLSPRQKQQSPLELPRQDNRSVAYNGARPRTYGNSVTGISQNELHPTSPRDHIPLRMTQSDLALREKSPVGIPVGMSQSVSDSRGKSYNMRNDRDSQSPLNRNEADNRYTRVSRESSSDRDYENVYDNRRQTDVKRPIDEHDEAPFVSCAENYDMCETLNKTPVQELNESVSALKICPMCSVECSRMTTQQFQMHVLECFDNEATPTMRPVTNEDDRTCPMCNATYPISIPQETFEKHVLSHFDEDPAVDRFEIVS